MSESVFRCYTYKQGDAYYAICLDLSLIERRESLDEAIAALDEDILGYLETVRSRGWESQLIPRSVLRRDWLRFYGLFLINAVLTLIGRRREGFMTFSRKEVPGSAGHPMRLTYA